MWSGSGQVIENRFRSFREAPVDTPRSRNSNAGVALLRDVPSTRNAMFATPVRERNDGFGPGRRSEGCDSVLASPCARSVRFRGRRQGHY